MKDLIKEAKEIGYKDGTIISYFKGWTTKLGVGEFEIDKRGRLIKYVHPKSIREENPNKGLYDVIYDEQGWTNIVKS